MITPTYTPAEGEVEHLWGLRPWTPGRPFPIFVEESFVRAVELAFIQADLYYCKGEIRARRVGTLFLVDLTF